MISIEFYLILGQNIWIGNIRHYLDDADSHVKVKKNAWLVLSLWFVDKKIIFLVCHSHNIDAKAACLTDYVLTCSKMYLNDVC